MSILDRHPAPWTEGCKRDFFDANGECFEMDKEDVAKLAAELAAARAENERLRTRVDELDQQFKGELNRVVRMDAENERLRDALENIRLSHFCSSNDPFNCPSCQARDALQGGKP